MQIVLTTNISNNKTSENCSKKPLRVNIVENVSVLGLDNGFNFRREKNCMKGGRRESIFTEIKTAPLTYANTRF